MPGSPARTGDARRIFTILAALVGTLLVAAPALAGATIRAEFASDFKSVTLSSSQDISYYQVTLCSGVQPKVESGRAKHLRLGTTQTLSFAEPTLSVTVKSSTTVQTFTGAPSTACEPGSEIPEAPLSILLPLSVIGTFLVAGLIVHRRRDGSSAA